MQLNEFVDVALGPFPGIEHIKQSWEPLLGYPVEQGGVVALDESPYLIDADESIPSVTQWLWDQRPQNTSETLTLIGSPISMMEEATLLGNSPFYGRFTGKIDPRQPGFAAAQESFPDSYKPENWIFVWGIFGGVPYYLDGIDLEHDLGTVIFDSLLSQRGYLHNEPECALRTELTEPNRYFAILEAIVAGNTTSNETAQMTGTDGKQASTYTQKLKRLRFIECEVPLTEEKARSRRSQYRILDPLFRFWFRFAYGNGDRYEWLDDEVYEAVIEPELPDFVGSQFEVPCRDVLPGLYPDETFLDIGQWWYKEHEVDVAGPTTEGTMVVGECKFTNVPLDHSVLASLEEHTEETR